MVKTKVVKSEDNSCLCMSDWTWPLKPKLTITLLTSSGWLHKSSLAFKLQPGGGGSWKIDTWVRTHTEHRHQSKIESYVVQIWMRQRNTIKLNEMEMKKQVIMLQRKRGRGNFTVQMHSRKRPYTHTDNCITHINCIIEHGNRTE